MTRTDAFELGVGLVLVVVYLLGIKLFALTSTASVLVYTLCYIVSVGLIGIGATND